MDLQRKSIKASSLIISCDYIDICSWLYSWLPKREYKHWYYDHFHRDCEVDNKHIVKIKIILTNVFLWYILKKTIY